MGTFQATHITMFICTCSVLLQLMCIHPKNLANLQRIKYIIVQLSFFLFFYLRLLDEDDHFTLCL